MHRAFTAPFLFRYAIAIAYRLGFLILRKVRFRVRQPLQNARVIIVGSFLAGGAGKTPLVREMANRFAARGLRVAVLCHAFAWDECRLLKSSCPGVRVLATRDRYAAARKLDGSFDVVLCDGGLEDTRFSGADAFALRWGERARTLADLVPCGRCVSLERDHPAAVAWDGARFSDFSERSAGSREADVRFGILDIRNGQGKEWDGKRPCLLMTAIGDPERFEKDLRAFGVRIRRRIFLKDHSRRFSQALKRELAHGLPIVLTEKDAVRLDLRTKENPLLYIARERVEWGSRVEDYLNAAAGGAAVNPPSML